ncbi:MAG: VCBS repeat-containing protein [Deltaproteobacteria bacterium]|nr:VCBS repeat-containing protein [Deltaproteobacteria bacterium]
MKLLTDDASKTRLALLLAPLLALSACEVPSAEPEPEPPTPPLLGDDDDATADDDDATGQEACDPALTLDPSDSFALQSTTLLTLTPSGGTGDYALALTTDASGAQLNADYGTYLPGDVPAVDDVVTLTDGGCIGSATATIHVVPPMDVSPTQVTAAPGTTFDLLVLGGSGDYACSLASGGTGGSVSASCAYTGGSEGIDLIRVEDLATGEVVDATVELVNGATLEPRPGRIWIPTGSTYELRIAGGSGYFTATATAGGTVTNNDGTLEAVSPGETVFQVVDDFTGQSAYVLTWGVEPLEGGFPRAGDNYITGDSASPGDIDGDGWADVVLGIEEADFGTYNSGAVHVYAGRDGGMVAAPVQTLTGQEYEDRFGASLHVADVTGDGELDLLVGTWLGDNAGTNAGRVELFNGVPGGFFETAASKTWTGVNTYDYLGYGLTSCDFNGDGYEDLALGVPIDEDRTVSEIAYSQGAVWLYLGDENGLPDQPSQKVYGRIPDGSGGWMYSAEVRMGSALEAGDVNGDGLCDLVVGAFEFEPPGENINDGAVYVFLGTDAGGSSAALYSEPVAAWAALEADSTDSYFGRELDVGDVDADGIDDILVGQYRHNVTAVSGSRHGAARLFLGEEWTATPASGWEMPSSADWSWYGNGSYDAVGWEVRLREMTGDGAADILIGGYSEEVPGGLGNTGAVVMFAGVPGALPADNPTGWYGGDLSGDLYGVRVEGLPDMDGDGFADLFVYASRAEHHGVHVGTPLFHPTSLGASTVPLDNPGESAGQKAGEGVAVLGDVNGDGFEDIAVGVPEYDNAGNQIQAGLVQVFFGNATGVSNTAVELKEFERYSDGDRWGWKVSGAGDFDGDGNDDLAVLARYDDRPSSFGSAFVDNPPCHDGGYNMGSVAIFSGGANGSLPSEPSFLWWGLEESDSSRVVTGGFDIDGDGFSDVIVGGMDWDGPFTNSGGFELIHGRPADASGIVALCNDGDLFHGPEFSGRLGQDVAPLGDIDNDGCDEVAIGAYDEDFGYSNQGVVRVLWGYGPNCGSPSPEVSLLVPQDTSARAGYSLDGGDDVDGDGVPDLLVGGFTRSTNGNSTGAAWVVPGSYLQSLPREAFVSGGVPQGSSPIAPPSGGPYTLTGTVQDEHFGRSVALLPGIGPGGTAGVAVGAPRSNLPGVERVGGVRIHLWDPAVGGIDPNPWGVFGGESFTPNGRVGEAVGGGSFGGAAGLVVGGFRASSWGPAQGAAWFVPISP